MNSILKSSARHVAVVAAMLASSAGFAHAAPGVDLSGHDASLAGTPIARSSAGSAEVTPGPNAKHLIYLGLNKEQALEQARSADAEAAAVAESMRRRAQAKVEAANARAELAR